MYVAFLSSQGTHILVIGVMLSVLCYSQTGRTALMAAVSKGHQDVVQTLLKHGADVLAVMDKVSHVAEHCNMHFSRLTV